MPNMEKVGRWAFIGGSVLPLPCLHVGFPTGLLARPVLSPLPLVLRPKD